MKMKAALRGVLSILIPALLNSRLEFGQEQQTRKEDHSLPPSLRACRRARYDRSDGRGR